MIKVLKIQLLFVAFVLLSISTHSLAGDGPQRLKNFLHKLDTLTVKFEQSVLDTKTVDVGRFQGALSISRPGKFRWDYVEPYEKLILADGDTVYIVDTDLEQVTYISQERALKGTPAGILINQGNIEDRFEIIDIGDSQGMAWVELLPKDKESQFTRVLLAFVEDNLRRMEMSDKFGQITRFQFYEMQRNPVFKDNFFVFDNPYKFDILNDI